jgi:hypothetical protein
MRPVIDFGPWSFALRPDDVGKVIAALGVASGRSTRADPLRRIIELAGDAAFLHQTLETREAVKCRIAPLLDVKAQTWAGTIRGAELSAVAAAWTSALGDRSPETRARLEIEPFPGDLGAYRWLFEQLGAPGVGAAPSIAATELASSAQWQWPLRVGFLGDEASTSFRKRLQQHAWAEPLYRIVSLDAEPADLAIMPGTLHAALAALALRRDVLDAGCIAVLGGFGRALDVQFADLLGGLRLKARPWAIVVADIRPEAADDWLSSLLYVLSHNATLDLAMEAALADRGPWILAADPAHLAASRLTRVASEVVAALPAGPLSDLQFLDFEPQSFGLEAEATRDELAVAVADEGNYQRESDGASATASLVRSATRARHDRPANVHPRWIQAEIRERMPRRSAVRRTALRPARIHSVDVWIGPESSAVHADRPFPDELLPLDRQTHRLTVVFIELDGSGRTTTGTVDLPPSGRGSKHRFWFGTNEGGAFHARIIVAFKGRVLQTATLSAPIGEPRRGQTSSRVTLTAELDVRPGLASLESRRPFGAAIVHNHRPGGAGLATILHSGQAVSLSLGGIERSVTKIAEVLSAAAFEPKSYGPDLKAKATVELLFSLTQHGAPLYTDLMSREGFREYVAAQDRIQIVAADPNAVLPLEFVYDLAAPARPPTLCPNARQALLDGHCDPRFHGDLDEEGHLKVVCPSGFWAVNRVIERHVANAEGVKRSGGDYLLISEPTKDRNVLDGLRGALFAASSRVDDVVSTSSAAVEAALTKSTSGNAARVRTWLEWVRSAGATAPSLLVLLAHSAADDLSGTVLEIEQDERRSLADINPKYLGPTGDARVGPIVLLLGCDTAIADQHYQTFVAQFRLQGAALVVGTIATVAGSHAAQVATSFVGALEGAGAAADGPVAFGDLLRTLRARLLADGEVMALALTAYGDADWRFPRPA